MTPFFSDFAAVCCSYCHESNVCWARNGANSSSISSTPTKHCNNVYYSLSLGTANKKIETLLQKMNKQLPYVQNISIIKERKNKHRCLYNRPWWFRCFWRLFWTTTTADPVRGEGGWTVFQKRLDGLVEFHHSLTDSKNRFDNLNGELWLGLDRIYRLTKIKNKLREDLTAFTRNTAFVLSNVHSSERNKYKLSLRKYSGNYSGENRKKKLIKSHSKIWLLLLLANI